MIKKSAKSAGLNVRSMGPFFPARVDGRDFRHHKLHVVPSALWLTAHFKAIIVR